ncbi:Neurogenic locus Notch protein [Camponotus floridanus]|uniref:Neurogenic locus Notch protein n=1 Tax=Camponotus floridanus TaxID=104421 RepID=E1ZXI4_CAMFO|nr:Neurogenic locus Notch protein [Camponotus floridanus]
MDRVNEYSCLCPPAFTGTQCELDVDECSVRPSLCHNGATCTNSHGSYSCICVNGWAGLDCSVNIDDCAGAACFNGATCIDRVGSFFCQCTYGKTGLLCHLDDACTSNPCHEGAICDTSPINGSFTCSCATGYKGLDCSEDIDECEQGSSPSLINSPTKDQARYGTTHLVDFLGVYARAKDLSTDIICEDSIHTESESSVSSKYR